MAKELAGVGEEDGEGAGEEKAECAEGEEVAGVGEEGGEEGGGVVGGRR